MSRAWGSLILAAVSVLPYGCLEGEPPVPPPAVRELRVPLIRDIQSLDPRSTEAAEIVTHNVVRLIYEGLVEYEPHAPGGETQEIGIVPRVAEAILASEDGTRWDFPIRSGVRFSDDPCFPDGKGREATAEDASDAIYRAIQAARTTDPGPQMPALRGLEAFLSGQSKSIEGVVVEAPRRLSLRLDRPDPFLLHFLARPTAAFVPREAVRLYGPDLRTNSVGTGPFRLVLWESSQIRLVRREDYWMTDARGVRLPYLDAIRFVSTGNSSTQMSNLYQEGEIDVLYNYSRPPLQSDEDRGFQVFSVDWLNTIFARFDFRSDHPAVRDPRVRRLLAEMDWSRPFRLHTRADGLFPPGLPGYDAELRSPHRSPEETRRLLEEAGFRPEACSRPLRVLWVSRDRGNAEFIRDRLREVGFKVEEEILPDATYRQEVRARNGDIFRDGWIADYPDPENFLQLFHSESHFNFGFYANPEYDRLFEELRWETEPERRVAIARRMQRILLDDAAAIFLRHERESQFVPTWIGGWEDNCRNSLNLHRFERVFLTEGARTARR